MASGKTPLDIGLSLALAVVASSAAPLVLLDGAFYVLAASSSFSTAFQLDEHKGCCQSNGNASPPGRALPYPELGLGGEGPPLGQCG